MCQMMVQLLIKRSEVQAVELATETEFCFQCQPLKSVSR